MEDSVKTVSLGIDVAAVVVVVLYGKDAFGVMNTLLEGTVLTGAAIIISANVNREKCLN